MQNAAVVFLLKPEDNVMRKVLAIDVYNHTSYEYDQLIISS